MKADYEQGEITERITGAAYKVYNTPGFGFLENVYEDALVAELSNRGLLVKQQEPIQVCYDGRAVGQYFADLTVVDSSGV